MLWHKAQGAGGVGGAIEYIGSVTKEVADVGSWDSVAEALDVLSIAQTGDLVVIAFSFDNDSDSTWSWNGMSFTDVWNNTGSTNPGAYVGYRFVQAGDANPYISGVSSFRWGGLTVVASVFRGVSSFENGSNATGASGTPNPPSLTAAGNLWIATGHLDDDEIVTALAPTNYTLAAFAAVLSGIDGSSTIVVYRIESLASDDPGILGTLGPSDEWNAVTLAFS